MEKDEIQKKIADLETEMAQPDFWSNKDAAQEKIRELNELKDQLAGVGKYDKSEAVVTIFAGAGGDDAEDWAKMLFEMYRKWAEQQGYGLQTLTENQNNQGGYRNIAFKI